jgi:ERCC4-type nuclease
MLSFVSPRSALLVRAALFFSMTRKFSRGRLFFLHSTAQSKTTAALKCKRRSDLHRETEKSQKKVLYSRSGMAGYRKSDGASTPSDSATESDADVDVTPRSLSTPESSDISFVKSAQDAEAAEALEAEDQLEYSGASERLTPEDILQLVKKRRLPEQRRKHDLCKAIANVIERLIKNGAPKQPIKLLVDNREHGLQHFFSMQPWVQVKTLLTCDFLFVSSTGRPLVGYERKTHGDLNNSIRSNSDKSHKHDHRYRSQKAKMLQLGAARLFYILEGDFCGEDLALETNCETKSTFRDSITWRRTENHLHTVLLIYRDALHFFEHGTANLFRGDHPQAPEGNVYDTFQNLTRKTVGLQFANMLACIPGFSPAKAHAVVMHYKTMEALVNDFQERDIANLVYAAKQGKKSRRLGPQAAKRLRLALFESPEAANKEPALPEVCGQGSNPAANLQDTQSPAAEKVPKRSSSLVSAELVSAECVRVKKRRRSNKTVAVPEEKIKTCKQRKRRHKKVRATTLNGTEADKSPEIEPREAARASEIIAS